MNKIDLIIENIEYAKLVTVQAHKDELLDEALAAARELKALKPVGYMDSRGVLFNKTTHPQLNTALYALDEVTK
jgi:3-hydroxyacyl-CoA dehydrogenase